MNRGLTMLMHAGMMGLVVYLVMVYAFKTSTDMAVNRSLIFASVALIYMVTVGHKLPSFTKST
jgi:FtsH-binding integral membrane protein